MASGLLSAELAATCNALGYYDGIKYHLEPHSKETIRDIIRYLRRDEDSHDIRRFLGNSKILKTDLLPILQCHFKEKDLFDLVLRLIVNLSTPALIVYNDIVPTDKSELNQYLQIVSHLQSYKEAFGDHKTWSPLSEQLSNLLNKDIDSRDEEDQRTIERILILVRNVLHVPSDALAEGRPDNDASLHDQVIWALHQSSMLDLLLYMASSSQECGFFLHLLEILCLLVREQPPPLLAGTAAQRSAEEKHRDEEELLRLRQKEQQLRQNKTRQYLGSRHSNFGGTFVIKNMKSTTDNDLIYHKPLHKVNHFSLDIDKKKVKIPKNRQPLKCGNVERRSALSVRLILKQFCVEILNAAYNPLMNYIKDCLSRGKTQDNDESYYFTAMKFFMEFNRHYKFQVKLVSETMSVESFHFTQKYLETWHEMMITDKKKISLWSARMHLALKAYKELLQNLAAMDSSPESPVRESSKVIKSNIFYIVEYREMLLTLINTYKKSKYSLQYLVDLMETNHIFLKLLEKFCQNKKLVVQHPVRKPRKKSKPKKKTVEEERVLAAEELWPQIQASLQNVLASPVTKEVIPFDAASDKTMDEQKIDAMKRIQILMKSGDIEECVALLRASREVWPENDCFGNQDMSDEEELNCLKEVFFAELDLTDTVQTSRAEPVPDEEEVDDEEEEETIYPTLSEKTFDIKDLVKRFASPKVLGVCITLLANFEKNTAFTNHCIAKMLHRIAWDCKLPSILFQASLFRKFQLILDSKDRAFKELAGLAVYVIRKFVEVAETNKKVFMELLFFKNAKDAYEIECGYGSFQSKEKSSAQHWEEHEEEELKRLHEEYLQNMPEQGMVEWITEQLINERSERMVKKKLKELDLTIITKNKKGLVTTWTEDQEEELRELYREAKELDSGIDIVGEILTKLKVPRSRQNVAKALVRLGFASSTSDFRRKQPRKGGRGGGRRKASSGGSSDSSDEEEEEEGNAGVQESREAIRAKESIPDLYHTTKLIFTEKEINSYLTEGLKWLKSSLADCLEDLEEDDPAEVPLLPLSSEAILSVENPEFKLFLSSLGIFKPLQQEIYWRFPAEWKETDFNLRQKLIDLIAENDLLDSHSDEIYALIKDITGRDPPTNETDSDSDRETEISSPSSSPSSTSIKPPSTSQGSKKKSKLQELKNRLLGADKSHKDTNNETTKKWSSENVDEANTEDFNAMVAEQCKELLSKEGINVSAKGYETSTKIIRNNSESDSDRDNEAARPTKRSHKTKKLKQLLDSDSEPEQDLTNLNKENTPLKSQFVDTNSEEERENGDKSAGDIMNRNSSKLSKIKQIRRIIDSDDEDLVTSQHKSPKLTISNSNEGISNTGTASEILDRESTEELEFMRTGSSSKLRNSPNISDEDSDGIVSNKVASSKRSRLSSDSESEAKSESKLNKKKKRVLIESEEEDSS